MENLENVRSKVHQSLIEYYGLVLAQKKKQVLENSLVVSEEVLQLAKAKYEVGQCSKLAYLNAQVQHNEEQAKLLSQEEVLTAAKLTLQSLLGKDGPEEFTIVEDIPVPSRLNYKALTEALEINRTMYALKLKIMDGNIGNIGGFTAQTFENKYGLGLVGNKLGLVSNN